MKIYCFSNGELDPETAAKFGMKDKGYHGIAITEDGHIVAQCVSSNLNWVMHDLGITSNNKLNHDRYAVAAKGTEYELEWIEDPKNSLTLKILEKKNQELAKKHKIAEAEAALLAIDKEIEENKEEERDGIN